jgi:hypothetical protein
VIAALGVDETGKKQLLTLSLHTHEGTSLLHGLIWADGAIRMRRMRGYRNLAKVLAERSDRAAGGKAA